MPLTSINVGRSYSKVNLDFAVVYPNGAFGMTFPVSQSTDSLLRILFDHNLAVPCYAKSANNSCFNYVVSLTMLQNVNTATNQLAPVVSKHF